VPQRSVERVGVRDLEAQVQEGVVRVGLVPARRALDLRARAGKEVNLSGSFAGGQPEQMRQRARAGREVNLSGSFAGGQPEQMRQRARLALRTWLQMRPAKMRYTKLVCASAGGGLGRSAEMLASCIASRRATRYSCASSWRPNRKLHGQG
jgi:hypothetical protein